MRKITSALAAFVLLATMAFLPATATAKAPNLLNAPKSKLFSQTDQCTICGYATLNQTGVQGVRIRVMSQSTFDYYEIYTDSQGYYEDKINVGDSWIVTAFDGTPSSGYDWHTFGTTSNSFTDVSCPYGTGTINYLPFFAD